MRILGLILARGGSKGIPKKNIKLLAGKPLLAYTAEEAKKSKFIDRLVLSTDSEEIAEVGRQYGAEVPFMRPKELAEDRTLDLPVFQHALEWLDKNDKYRADIVVHLRPTTPFRIAEEIDEAVRLLIEHPEADSVRGVCAPDSTPYKMWKIKDDGFLEPLLNVPGIEEPYNAPRQILPKAYNHPGYIDVIRYATIMDKNSMTGKKIFPFFHKQEEIIDIDKPFDLAVAEELIKFRRQNIQ